MAKSCLIFVIGLCAVTAVLCSKNKSKILHYKFYSTYKFIIYICHIHNFKFNNAIFVCVGAGWQLLIPDGQITSSPPDSTVKIGDKLTVFCAYPSYMLPHIQKPRICHDDFKDGKKFGTVCHWLDTDESISGKLVNLFFHYTPSHRGEHGLKFTCSNLAGSVKLNLLCKF